ncbi:MAG: regulatory protein RecX [Motiliproteus sp.]
MKKSEVSLLSRAYGLLARREHSRRELQDKLRRYTDAEQELQLLLDSLTQQGLQSDQRFAVSFVRSRVNRGHGLIRIRQDLKKRGLSTELVSQVLIEAEADWYQLALQVRIKRFGAAAVNDRKEYARQVRFLLYRGFNQDQIHYAMTVSEDEIQV